MGSWTFSRPMVALASLGVILAAGYILWMVQRVLYGEVTNPVNRTLPDLSAREFVVLIPLVVLAIVMGVASPYFTRLIEPSVQTLIYETNRRARAVPATTARPRRRSSPRVGADDDARDARPSSAVPGDRGGDHRRRRAAGPGLHPQGRAGAGGGPVPGRPRGSADHGARDRERPRPRDSPRAERRRRRFRPLLPGPDPRHRHPRRAPLAFLPPRDGDGPRRVLRPDAVRHRRHDGPRLGPGAGGDLRRPRDHVHRRLRPGRAAPGPRREPGSRAQVLHHRRVLVGLLPLRRRHPLRPHRARRRWPASPARCGRRPSRPRPSAPLPRQRPPPSPCWARACCWWGSASRWRACRSTCGRPMPTRGPPPR